MEEQGTNPASRVSYSFTSLTSVSTFLFFLLLSLVIGTVFWGLGNRSLVPNTACCSVGNILKASSHMPVMSLCLFFQTIWHFGPTAAWKVCLPDAISLNANFHVVHFCPLLKLWAASKCLADHTGRLRSAIAYQGFSQRVPASSDFPQTHLARPAVSENSAQNKTSLVFFLVPGFL